VLSPSARATRSPSVESVSVYMQSNSGSTAPKRKKTRRSIEKNDIDTELLKALKNMDNRTEDEDEIFCKAIACELHKVRLFHGVLHCNPK
jgi:hypothetical protein